MVLQVKICGLKDDESVLTAIEAGADFIGLVFFPKSPRHLEITEAAKLADLARGRVKIVALVVDASNDELAEIITHVAPDYLQLHGRETPERVDEISKLYQIPLIKAIGVKTQDDALLADDYPMAEIILFDAKADPKISELPGGNGIPFDWEALSGQKEQRNFMLSGGLNAENVKTAITLTGATIVDVSSGVERAVGVKDTGLIKTFIETVKTA